MAAPNVKALDCLSQPTQNGGPARMALAIGAGIQVAEDRNRKRDTAGAVVIGLPGQTLTDSDEMIVKPAFGRLAASHIGEFLLKRGIRWQRVLKIDRVDTIILQAVTSANLAHLTLRDAGLEASNSQRRPTSVLAVSSSMGLDHTTVRRRVYALVERGILQASGNGYIAPFDRLIYGEPNALVEHDCLALHALLDLMRAQGFRSLPKTNRSASSSRVGRATIDFATRSLEGFVEQHGSITSGSIWAAIISANVRDHLNTGQLPEGYAQSFQPLPDHERRAVSLRKLATEVNLPFETVRRHVLAMAERGSVLIGERGVIVPVSALTTPQQIARSRINIGYLRRLFDSVASS